MAKGSGGTGRLTPLAKIEIDNTRAAGKFARGFETSILAGKITDKNTVEFDFAPISYSEYKPGKMAKTIMELPQGIGISYEGYKKQSPKWYGKEIIAKARIIKGKTFEIKNEIKKLGFSWNSTKKQWEK